MESVDFDSKFDFASSTQTIIDLSDKIAGGPADLLTGPLLIECTEPTICNTVEDSLMESYHVVPNSGNTLILSGKHQVYNYFTVDMKDWFYSTSDHQSTMHLLVDAEGFVFVTVIDKSEIAAGVDETHVTVSRDWDAAPSFDCDIGSPNFAPDKAVNQVPLVANNVDDEEEEPHQFYNMRKIVTGDIAQDPSTHMLVNYWTTLDHLESDVSYNETKAEWCTGLHYRFKAKWHDNKVTKSTLLLPNVASEFEMREYSWEGGQFITTATSVHLRDVSMDAGLHIADHAYSCVESAGSAYTEEEEAIII